MKQISNQSSAGLILACSVLLLGSLNGPSVQADTDPRFYAVQVSASVQRGPAQITLSWAADGNASSYTVYRKDVKAADWGAGTTLPGSATSYGDTAVSEGVAYEYQISKTTGPGYAGYGYVCAGIGAPFDESRGKVLLLVDSLYAGELANELSRLQQDLVGDGWMVLRRDVSRTDSPANIKTIIRSYYDADRTNLRTVFLFGHIPVPYSGNFNPDGHPDHQGAWPADVYYGDMDGSWTDNSVSNTSAQRQANWNVPGDGKFDQSELPSDVELEVGRVDLSNMTCFSNKNPARYEKDLLKQYLDKDHTFRHGLMAIQRRGLVCDNFGEKSGEAFAASGWRNFSAFFGAANVTAAPAWNYFSTLGSQSYLWSYGCGGGSYYTCDGVGSSDDFALTDVKSVFMMFVGSYFGDWDNESNFLRAPLGSTSSGLAVAWAGRPHWFFHHMGLGQTIGYSTRLSQNNRNGGSYSPQNYSTRGTHVALLGDPTLRMHPVIPPSGLKGTVGPNSVTLAWTPSPDSNLQGYVVYRSSSPEVSFSKVSGSAPIGETSFTDSTTGASTATYMVRAIKLEESGSGTYYNPSQGVFFGPDSNTSWGGSGSPPVVLPAAPAAAVATVRSASQVSLSWTDTTRDETGFKVERKTGADGAFAKIATLGPNVTSFNDSGLAPGTVYVYRVSDTNSAGDSAYSNEAAVSTPSIPAVPASAAYVLTDRGTGGNWKGLYGNDGYQVIGAGAAYPAYASVAPSGESNWTWEWPTADGRALQHPESPEGVAACWYSTTSFTVELNLLDGHAHQVAFYFVDWDSSARRQTVDMLDASSGAILNSQALDDFHGGGYFVWNLAGHVRVRLTRNGGLNAALSGIFFDSALAAPETAAAPTIDPPGGIFADPATVTLSSATAGATIRYTLDGTEPTLASATYEVPFLLSLSATVRAKAFKTGLAESPSSSASFLLNAISRGEAQALFVRADTSSHGNWKGVYGSEGHIIVGDRTGPAVYPDYVQVGTPAGLPFVWSESTTDVRALRQINGPNGVAGCWTADTSFDVDVDFIDGRTHRVALYCLDWDTTQRSQTVEILDAATGALLTSRSLAGFNGGTYLVWDVKGHVQVRFTRLGGNNAVLMGIFFSPAAIQLGNADSGAVSVGDSALAAGAFQLRVSGQVGERFVINASSDLRNWTPLGTVTLPAKSVSFTDPDASRFPNRFYRALPVSGGN